MGDMWLHLRGGSNDGSHTAVRINVLITNGKINRSGVEGCRFCHEELRSRRSGMPITSLQNFHSNLLQDSILVTRTPFLEQQLCSQDVKNLFSGLNLPRTVSDLKACLQVTSLNVLYFDNTCLTTFYNVPLLLACQGHRVLHTLLFHVEIRRCPDCVCHIYLFYLEIRCQGH